MGRVWALLAALVALAVSAAPAAAHLVTVPNTSAGRAAVDRTGADVVARYDAFTLVDASTGDVAALRDAGADQHDEMERVRTAAGNVDPATRPPLRAGGEDALALVQFAGPIKDAWLDRVRATGVEVVTYQAENAYLVHGTPAEQRALESDLAGDSAVRALTAFTAGDKLGGGLEAGTPQRVIVQTIRGARGAAARRRVDGAASRQFGDTTSVAGFTTQVVRVTNPASLAEDPGVVSIQPAPTYRLRDERADQILSGNIGGGLPLLGSGYLAWLQSQGFGTSTFGFAVDISDEGVDRGQTGTVASGHPDFQDRIVYAHNFGSDTTSSTGSGARDCGGHGTINASITAGSNTATGAAAEDAGGFNYGEGVAPQALLGSSKIFDCNGSFNNPDLSALASQAYAGGARISNNSWGSSTAAYNADSQALDARTRDAQTGSAGNQELTYVVANGNDGPAAGSVGAPATAKNVISVGATEGVRASGTDGCSVADDGADDPDDIIDFSSRGPTADGRQKPDVVAPGTHITGARPQTGADFNGSGVCTAGFPAGSTLYDLSSGTSHSTPVVSGEAALVRDWYTRNHSGTPPSPAMVKALILNSATDVQGGVGAPANVPDQNQGWGRASLATLLDGESRDLLDQDHVLGASGQSFTDPVTIAGSRKPVRITLVWTDPPGPTSGASYVNNLDLTVTAGGTTYKGNVFRDGQSTAGGTADAKNNVESVYLPARTSGTVGVTVTATNIAGDGVPGNGDSTDQDFALVVSHGDPTPTAGPDLQPDTTTVRDWDGRGDGVLDPGEPFTLDQGVANEGGAPATGVTGTLSAVDPNVAVAQSGSAYPDIAPTASAANQTHFTGTLGAGARCGVPARVSLQVTSAQGTSALPVNLPVGATTAIDSADVPKAIPDNNSTGVQSALALTGAGVVGDVNATVTIAHPFDGDLIVSLIGPDNTTVVLANRRGGAGDDFSATTFDDEAPAAIASGAAPFSGRYRPDQALSAFDGHQMQGTWRLKVADRSNQDTGSLLGWGVAATDCSAEPDPGPLPNPPTPGGGTTSGGGPNGDGTLTPAATPTQDARDARAPTIRLSARAGRLGRALRLGFRHKLTCDEGCTIVSQLQQVARGRVTIVARGRGKLAGAGTAKLTDRFTTRARRRFRRSRRLRLTLVVRAVDAAGNGAQATKKLTFRR